MNTDNSWSRCANEFVSLVNTVDDEFLSAEELDDLKGYSRRRISSDNALSSRKSIVATDIALANIEQIETTELVSRWIAREICTPLTSDQNPSSRSVDLLSELEKSPIIKSRPKSVRRSADCSTRVKRQNRSPDLTRSPIIGNGRFGRRKRRRFNTSEKEKAGECRSSHRIKFQVDKPSISGDDCDYLRKNAPETNWDTDISSLAYQYFELGDLSVINNLANCKRQSCSAMFTESKAVSAVVEKKGAAARIGSIELSQDFFDEDKGTDSPPLFDEEEKTHSIFPCEKRNVDQRFSFFDVNRSPSPPKNTEGVSSSVIFEAVLNKEGQLRGFKESDDARKDSAYPAKEKLAELNDTQLSQDLFDEEPDLTNSRLIPANNSYQRQGISTSKTKWLRTENGKEEEIVVDPESSLSSRKSEEKDEYLSEMKAEKDYCELEVASVRSLNSIIQDTEELLPLSPLKIRRGFIIGTPAISDLTKEDNKFLILDSELSPEKNKFVRDTERIDYDTSSENGEDNPDVEVASNEPDSDRTVSDIIEEPLTQDYIESSKPGGLASGSLLDQISAVSSKISESISSIEPVSIDISVEATPPSSIQESFAGIPDLLFRKKKKKSRPKKGSLGARLRNLVSGQVSYVRLWRYQISQDTIFQQTSTPCITLSVTEASFQYEKNFYLSRVLEDPHGSLNDYSGTLEVEKNEERNLVVMTNPEFVKTLKMPRGTIFKVYSPWKIFNRETSRGDLILHALYIKTVSVHSSKDKENSTESRTARDHLKNKVIHEYDDCPCLETGKIEDSCSVKFTNQKINVMDVIFNEK